jgi:hypothetical protein
MKGKILLFVFLLALLAGLIYFKPFQIPQFSSITGLFSKVFSNQKLTYFKLTLDSIKNEQTFNLLNTTFSLEGICITPITIGKVSIQMTSKTCKVEMYSPNGIIKLNGKNVYVEATSPLIKINGVEYVTSEKVYFYTNVATLLANVFAQNLNINNFNGKFEKLSGTGVSTIINFPPCESIEILDFSGSLSIGEQTTLLGNGRVSYWCENDKKQV